MAGPKTSALQATQGTGTNIGFRDLGGGVYSQRVDSFPGEAFQFAGAKTLTIGTSTVGTTGSAGTFSISSTGSTVATHGYISIEGAVGIRFWNTGDTPTAGTAGSGHFLATGAGPLEVDNLALLKMVTADSTSNGTVQLSQHTYI